MPSRTCQLSSPLPLESIYTDSTRRYVPRANATCLRARPKAACTRISDDKSSANGGPHQSAYLDVEEPPTERRVSRVHTYHLLASPITSSAIDNERITMRLRFETTLRINASAVTCKISRRWLDWYHQCGGEKKKTESDSPKGIPYDLHSFSSLLPLD